MAILSPLRARRNANRPVEPTQQVIIFCLRHRWFALPLEAVKQVMLNSDSSNGKELTSAVNLADDAKLTVINADQKIFLDSSGSLNPKVLSQEPEASERFSMVLQTPSGHLFNVTINTPPKMCRISPSSIVPFLLTDSALESMQCVSSVVDQSPPLYLLNLEQFCGENKPGD